METLKKLQEVRGKLYDKIKDINEEINDINEKINEIEIANAIAYCSDEEKLRKDGAPIRFTKSYVSLKNRNFFNEIVELLPDDSYICGYNDDRYWTDGTHSGPCRTTNYLLMVNAKNAIVFKLTEKYDKTGIKFGKDFSIEVYVGANNLKIRAEAEDFDGETQVVRIVDSNDNYEVFSYIVEGDYTLFDGQDVVDVIKTVDLNNFIIKDSEEDYHFQKVKK